MGNQQCKYNSAKGVRMSTLEFSKDNGNCLVKNEILYDQANASTKYLWEHMLRHYESIGTPHEKPMRGILWHHSLTGIPETKQCSQLYLINHAGILKVLIIEPQSEPPMSFSHIIQALVWSMMRNDSVFFSNALPNEPPATAGYPATPSANAAAPVEPEPFLLSPSAKRSKY